MNTQVGKFIFLNNALGQFYRTFLNWFADSFYNQIQTKVIGTYSKAVTKLNKRITNEDNFDVILPAIILDPSGDFRADDRLNHLWRYDGLAPQFGKDMFEPIYQDNYIRMSPIFNRFIGEIEITFLLRSIYEYLDLRLYIIQSFSNENRYNRPFFVNTFLTLPEEIINYSTIDSDGNEYKIDWNKALLEYKLIQNINKKEYCIPLVLSPMFKFTSLSDSSNKKAVGSELEDYRLSLSIEYEIDLPVYFVVESFFQIQLPPVISIGSGFASTEYELPDRFTLSSDNLDIDGKEYVFKKAYYFDIKTQDELDDLKEGGINIPDNLQDENCLTIIHNGNVLEYEKDYKLRSDYLQQVNFTEKYKSGLKIGDHIEFAIYELITDKH